MGGVLRARGLSRFARLFRRPSCGWREYLAGSLRTALVLAIGLPIVMAQLAFYYLRRRVFGIPMNGYWGEFGQCEAFIKGPNTWNAHPPGDPRND